MGSPPVPPIDTATNTVGATVTVGYRPERGGGHPLTGPYLCDAYITNQGRGTQSA